MRVLRHQIENNTREKLVDISPLIAWMVRWAAELLSKHTTGMDGKTPYQRIREEDCVVPLVLFGERVLYLPMKTVRQDKGEV